MVLNLKPLADAPRLLLQATLKPLLSDRFQPTGFPDLGAAEFVGPSGKRQLLVESAQSMANRLEAVCWDESKDSIIEPLAGLPYVRVDLGEHGITTSLLEFHRLNSPYLMDGRPAAGGESFKERLSKELGLAKTAKAKKPDDESENAGGGDGDEVAGTINLRKLAATAFRFDPNSVIHGLFLEKIAGRLRLTRALSAFVEAQGVERADAGGVKFDRVFPKPSVAGLDAKGGYGNVPFHRTEYTAESITASFNLDLSMLRGYGLPTEAETLLIALSLYKIRRVVETGLRFRSACDLECVATSTMRPAGFALPESAALAKELPELIRACRDKKLFADPTVTELKWAKPAKTPKAEGK